MSGISNKYSQHTGRTENTKHVQTVETAGSLAMNTPFNYFSINSYDSFSTNNPIAINYSDYSSAGCETTAIATGFWSNIAMLSNISGSCAGAVSSGTSSGGSCGGGGCSGGGVFC